MLGIVHLSPMTVSVIIERSQFKREYVRESEAKDGSWSEKITNMLKQPKDGRERVLFVERLNGLQAMLKNGLPSQQFKIVLYDDIDVLKHVSGVHVIDARHNPGGTWRLYKMLPDEFNSALASTSFGVPDGLESFDIAAHEEDKVPDLKPAKKTKSKGLAGADAVMASILGGINKEVAPPPSAVSEALADADEDEDEDELPPQLETHEDADVSAEDEDEPPPPQTQAEPAPVATEAAQPTVVKPEPVKAEKKPRKPKTAAPKVSATDQVKSEPAPASKPKKKALESYKLF